MGNDTEPKRVLGLLSLTFISIGTTLGAGIFVVTGVAAAKYAGPAIIVSFALATGACMLVALCYAELSALIPKAGGAYTYTYAAFGRFAGWNVGWLFVGIYLVGLSLVAAGWAGYFVTFLGTFGLALPALFVRAPVGLNEVGEFEFHNALANLPAMFLVAICTAMAYLGIKQSTRINNVLVLIKLAVILLVGVFGLFHANASNWEPFLPENEGVFGRYGWSGLLTGASVAFVTFIGFDAATTVAHEAKNPERDLPIAIIVSLASCGSLYVLIGLALTGMVDYRSLDVADPVLHAVASIDGGDFTWLLRAISVSVILGLMSVVLVLLIVLPRLLYAQSKDRLLPEHFGRLDPVHGTPYFGILSAGVIGGGLSGMLSIEVLAQYLSIFTLAVFAVVCSCVLRLRVRQPHLARPFRIPFGPLIPISGIAICGVLMIALPMSTWLGLVAWLAVAGLIYLLYRPDLN